MSIDPKYLEEKGLPADFPKNKEELDKLVQSASSKGKNELLQEIGINNVKDIKSAIEKGTLYDATVKEKEAIAAEKETLTASLAELNTQKEELATKLTERDQKLLEIENAKLIKDNNIPEGAASLFIKLVDEDQTENLSRAEKATKISEQLFSLAGGIDSLGKGKTPPPNADDIAKQAIRAAAGLPPK